MCSYFNLINGLEIWIFMSTCVRAFGIKYVVLSVVTLAVTKDQSKKCFNDSERLALLMFIQIFLTLLFSSPL